MGMFDYLLIEQKIEGLPELSDQLWAQTKSFDRNMSKYVIRDDKLYKVFETWQATDELLYERDEWKVYKQELVSSYEGQYEYHGDIHFSGFLKETGQWEQFVARFSEGILQWVMPQEKYNQLKNSSYDKE